MLGINCFLIDIPEFEGPDEKAVKKFVDLCNQLFEIEEVRLKTSFEKPIYNAKPRCPKIINNPKRGFRPICLIII